MRLSVPLVIASVVSKAIPALCFGSVGIASSSCSTHGTSSRLVSLHASSVSDRDQTVVRSRRSFFTSSAAFISATGIAGILPFRPDVVNAEDVPSVTVEEFEAILRDSAKSVMVVEFSGPKSETATVRLVDGTTFGISDLVESPSDPRSPLKLVATCRGYRIPTKSIDLELAVKATPKKKKIYMNKNLQKAVEKEKLKKERMAQDEEERLAELYRMEEEEAMRQLSKAQ